MSEPRPLISSSPAFRPGALPQHGRIAIVKGQDMRFVATWNGF